MNQAADTNLDQDLHTSRSAKYEKGQQEVRQWVLETSGTPQNIIAEYNSRQFDLIDILKDGDTLCKLGKLVDIPNNPCSKFRSSRMPFVQMENISFFLLLAEAIGVPHDETFETVDLFERKDPYQVIIALISFSRRAHDINPSKFSPLGPKPSKVKPTIPRKPIHLSQKGM